MGAGRGPQPVAPAPVPVPAAAGAARGAAGGSAGVADWLHPLRPSVVWGFLRRQPLSYWMVLAYVFMEYVRPQTIYTGLAVVPWSQIFLIVGGITLFSEGYRIRSEGVDNALVAFTGIVLLTSVTALDFGAARAGWTEYFNWFIVYFLIANIVNSEARFVVLMATYMLWNLKMSQHGFRSWAESGFGFRTWGIVGPQGYFANSGEFAIQMAVFFCMSLAFINGLRARWRRWARWGAWFLPVSAAVCVVGSSSRGGLIALAAAALWLLMKSRHKVRGLVATALLAGLVWVMLPAEQKQRFQEAGDDKTSNTRELYWERGQEIIAQRPALGIGFNNWQSWHQKQFGYEALPHNILIEATAEMGYLGLFGFLSLVVATLVVNAKTRRITKPMGEAGRFMHDMSNSLDAAMIAFLVAGQFVTVLFWPYFWINLALAVALRRSAEDSAARIAAAATADGLPPAAGLPRRAVAR